MATLAIPEVVVVMSVKKVGAMLIKERRKIEA